MIRKVPDPSQWTVRIRQERTSTTGDEESSPTSSAVAARIENNYDSGVRRIVEHFKDGKSSTTYIVSSPGSQITLPANLARMLEERRQEAAREAQRYNIPQ